MGTLFEDLIMLVFVHFVSSWLFFYVATKLFSFHLTAENLALTSALYSLFSYSIRKSFIYMDLPISLFIPLNLLLMIFTLIIVKKMPWRYATIGTLISFASIVVWGPITYLVAGQLGWGYPNNSIAINLMCGYLEMFGLILLAIYLKLTKKNIFSIITINKIKSRSE